MIDYDALEDYYGDLTAKQTVAKPTGPVGSRTDQARFIKPRRDGAHKRQSDGE